MEQSPITDATFEHDAFISYSRKNAAFASALEDALERYRPPKDLEAPQRFLTIFRDTQDFTGNEYFKSLDKHLAASAKLVVICSPEARRSQYVDGEIRRFVDLRGADHLVPVLLSGIPNNEVGEGQEAEQAFPAALCEVMTIPLAADFRGIAQHRPKIRAKRLQDAWYKTLADLYGLPRTQVEQREKKRQARSRRVRTTVAVGLVAIVSIAGGFAIRFRQDAETKARIARQLSYVDDVQRAKQEYENTNLPGMATLLTAAAPSTDRPEDLRSFEWYYLWRLSHSGAATEIVRDPSAGLLAVSPNGTVLATASGRTVKLWSLQTHQQIAALDPQEGDVTSLAFSSDGTLLATASEGRVRTWYVATGKRAAEIAELGAAVDQVAFSPRGKRIAGLGYRGPEKLARVWDLGTGRMVAELSGGITASGSGLFMAFSPDGSRLALSNYFGVEVHAIPSGDVVGGFQDVEDFGRASAATFSHDGKTLIAATEDGQLLFYDTAARGKPFEANTSGPADSLAVAADGTTLAVVSNHNNVELWDLESRTVRSTLRHPGDVRAMAFTPDGRLATVSEGAVRLWDVAARPEYDELGTLGVLLNGISPSPTNEEVALLNGNSILIWDTATRQETARLDNGDEVRAIAFAPGRRLVAVAGGEGGVLLWEAPAKTMSRLSHAPCTPVYAVAFAPDGKLLASAGADGVITLWDVERREPLAISFVGHTKDVTSIAFSPDGKRLATGGDDRTVRLWDATSGVALGTARAGADAAPVDDEDREPFIARVRFSPDGGIVAATTPRQAVLWRVSPLGALEELATLATHTDRVNDLAFSPDGRRIATASADTTVKLWDTSLLQEIITFREPKSGHERPEFIRGRENQVSSVGFSHDGRTLVTGLLDGTVRFRRAASHTDVIGTDSAVGQTK